MNKITFCFLTIVLGLLFAWPALAFPNDNPSSLLAGRILVDNNSIGGLWYVNPGDFHRYSISDKINACQTLVSLSLGVSNADFEKIASSAPDRLKGRFLIKPEDHGRIFYVSPFDKSLIYIGNPQSALFVLGSLATTTVSQNLQDVPVAKIISDESGKEIKKEWQNLGWWAKVNVKLAPVFSEPKAGAKKLGSFSSNNRFKVLAEKRVNGVTWYQVDGGRYPGGYIESKFVDAIPQPVPTKIAVLPVVVKEGDNWIDVDIAREVLTYFKGSEPIFATYVSTGMKDSPTIVGSYNIQYKFIKTRMHGAPPTATHYYDLANVPWTMYYHGSFGVHGAYWHDDFGVPKSSGCTNMTIGDSKFLFDLTSPKIGNTNMIRATIKSRGTVVNNHY